MVMHLPLSDDETNIFFTSLQTAIFRVMCYCAVFLFAASRLPCLEKIAHEIQNLLSFQQRAGQPVLWDTAKQVLW